MEKEKRKEKENLRSN